MFGVWTVSSLLIKFQIQGRIFLFDMITQLVLLCFLLLHTLTLFLPFGLCRGLTRLLTIYLPTQSKTAFSLNGHFLHSAFHELHFRNKLFMMYNCICA